jgi:hypothetical protein
VYNKPVTIQHTRNLCSRVTRCERRRATRSAAAAPKRTKNGHSSRADALSMGPSALDRETRTAPSSVRQPPLAPLPAWRAPLLAPPSKTGLGGRFDTFRMPLWRASLARYGRSALVFRRRSDLIPCGGQARRSDPCSRHLYVSGGWFACFFGAGCTARRQISQIVTAELGPAIQRF